MMTDLSIMISVARAVVEKRPLPHLPVETLTLALARTVLFLAETPPKPAKEIRLSSSDRSQSNEDKEPA